MDKREFGKIIIAGLSSTLLTMIVMWVTLVQSFVTESQALELVENRSPYVQDRKIILRSVELTEKLVASVSSATTDIAQSQAIIVGKLDGISQQVSGLQTRISNLEERVLFVERENKKK
jgi:pyruvate/2-oxoglutarate/acetoin dehydrogenase E1 component